MYALQVLNSAGEYELVTKLFKTPVQAIAFFAQELSVYEDYIVQEVV